MRNETREVGAFEMRTRVRARNRIASYFSYSSFPEILEKRVRFGSVRSNFARIVGKYKGKRNGRGELN